MLRRAAAVRRLHAEFFIPYRGGVRANSSIVDRGLRGG
jgi:hypothetical protein